MGGIKAYRKLLEDDLDARLAELRTAAEIAANLGKKLLLMSEDITAARADLERIAASKKVALGTVAARPRYGEADEAVSLITISEVTLRYSISEKSLYRLRRAGRFPDGFRLGNEVAFRRDEVESWFANRPENSKRSLAANDATA